MKFLAVGNEQWGKEYTEHLEPFIEAIRKQYPDIQIIGSAGPYSGGEMFDYLWPEMKRLKVDLVDEHYYAPERWFIGNADRYDSYDRQGPKVFAGEYACHGVGKKWNHFHAALLEAAFMTGLERNADIVQMATYAPLFAHVEGWQWRPDLIWFDNLNSVLTSSYKVQQLYSHNKGTNTAKITMNRRNITGEEGQNELYASAVWDESSDSYIIKVVNIGDKPQPITLRFAGLQRNRTLKGTVCTTLTTGDADSDNTLDNPNLIEPKDSPIDFEGTAFTTMITPQTFAIYRFQLR
jgi:alpha-L-arabinofuranosidase